MIDQAAVLKLATSAQIELAVEEVARIAAQLTDILDQMAPLAELGADVSPSSENAPQPLREDVPGADPLHGSIGRFAPQVHEGFFAVPRLPTHGGAA